MNKKIVESRKYVRKLWTIFLTQVKDKDISLYLSKCPFGKKEITVAILQTYSWPSTTYVSRNCDLHIDCMKAYYICYL